MGQMRDSLQPSARLEELVLSIMAAQRKAKPKPEQRDHDFVTIEVIQDEEEDAVVTDRFVKLSTPYERVDIEPLREKLGKIRSNQFARTIQVFDPTWFEKEAVSEYVPPEPRNSWWWLAISLVIGGLAVAALSA